MRTDPRAEDRLVCTNHLLHRWPDPARLPIEDGSLGTAAWTYERWRTLQGALSTGAVVDRADIREQFTAVSFGAPLQEARTFWHAQYDVEGAAMDVSFFLHDVDGASTYAEPIRVELGDG